ncbi:hypothetical protein LTS15_008178 [Exophiala xenobiotica]|nr:hypothetical protein LTS15_008178 [Exophiala xenobiotica]
MTDPERERRRRKRPAAKRKIRCNRELPCNNCLRSKNAACVYEEYYTPVPRRRQNQSQSVHEQHSPISFEGVSASIGGNNASIPASKPSDGDVASMKNRIRDLERQLSQATGNTSKTNTPASVTIATRDLPEASQDRIENGLFGAPRMFGRTVLHKSRQFGQSHWINGISVFLDLLDVLEPHIRNRPTAIPGRIQRCKSLAKIIKSGRTPPWPTPLSADLPPKGVADQLVERYLRIIEPFYRVLHIPTFKKHYETIWVSNNHYDAAFMVQLKLVLAIGSTTYDEQFSLRASAIRWIYEAQTWLCTPNSKARLNMQSLQINILLLLARELVDVCGDLTWISAGTLYRRAVYMGLHRDPAGLPRRTTFATEMRRRLWNTVLEITLRSSMNSGGPPSISLDDFDTKPPNNFDDDQLEAQSPSPRPEDTFTQVSTAIALRQSFPQRLAVVKFLNDLDCHGRYEDMLRLDGEIRVSYRAMCRTLQGFKLDTGRSPSQHDFLFADLVMNRYLASLHIPFFERAMHETAYAFSRKVLLETSLKLWHSAYQPSSVNPGQIRNDASSSSLDDLARLGVCGTVCFQTGPFQAACLIAAELRAQLQEQEGLSFTPPRPDLLPVLKNATNWCLHSIKIGETNVKGYLFLSMVAAQIDGLVRGINKDDFPKLLVKAVEEAIETSLSILEEQVAQSQSQSQSQIQETGKGFDQPSFLPSLESTDGCDDMTPESLFDFGELSTLDWMLDDDYLPEAPLW